MMNELQNPPSPFVRDVVNPVVFISVGILIGMVIQSARSKAK
jgi:hypothetical protein